MICIGNIFLCFLFSDVVQVFFALYDACIGKMSNKFARRERRYLIEKIRKDLSEQQQDELGSVTDVQGKAPFPGVVSEKAVYRELHRQILQGYREKKKLQISQEAFQAMKYIYDRSKVSLKKALQKRFRTLAGKCFYAWSDWIYMVSVGLDRKRWTGPRKYEVSKLVTRVICCDMTSYLKLNYNCMKSESRHLFYYFQSL